MIGRLVEHRVPLRVATGTVPDSPRVRMSRRRLWKSVQFDVEVSSRKRSCEAIQASPLYLPALLLTGEMPAGLAENAAQAGVQLVSKPIDAEGLIALLTEATTRVPMDAA